MTQFKWLNVNLQKSCCIIRRRGIDRTAFDSDPGSSVLHNCTAHERPEEATHQTALIIEKSFSCPLSWVKLNNRHQLYSLPKQRQTAPLFYLCEYLHLKFFSIRLICRHNSKINHKRWKRVEVWPPFICSAVVTRHVFESSVNQHIWENIW